MEDCFRYLGFKRLSEVDDLSFYEYRLLMRANLLKQIDHEKDLYTIGWAHRLAMSTQTKGNKTRYVATSFKDIFDYDAILKASGLKVSKEDEAEKQQKETIKKLIKKANYGKGGN